MPADIESQRVRAGRVAEAADLLREHARAERVTKVLRERYPELEHSTVYKYVRDAAEEVGAERARKLNARRCLDVNELKSAMGLLWKQSIAAAKAGQYMSVAMLLKTWQACMGQKLRAEHLDKISPLMGLEARETRAQLVEALRDNAHLLTEEQRQELRDALSEISDEDESVTTTMEAR